MNFKYKESLNAKYEVHILNVKDADCIIIMYQAKENTRKQIIVIDAGNISDSEKIKNYIKERFNTTVIDLAICTHPDRDHKGGFFGLFEDKDVIIQRFWCINPYHYINDDDFSRMRKGGNKKRACEKVFDHPTESNKNLLTLARKEAIHGCTERIGDFITDIPIQVIGPSEDYYRQAALGMVSSFAELSTEPDMERYDEMDEVPEEKAVKVIDEETDESYTNKSSMILLFSPDNNSHFLLPGDASSDSLRYLLNHSKENLSGCILKVPHHGSRRNLNSSLINDLRPCSAIISAAGNEKHPNKYIVRYLSKYCNVYSTHKSGDLYYSSEPIENPATPLKKRIK